MDEGKIENTTNPEKTEYISSTAVRTQDGQIFIGRSSHDAIDREIFEKDISLLRNRKYGFMTNTGRFVDRIEAAQIASASEQILKPVRELSSENLRFPKKLE
jgi:hypothetical protein